MFLKHKATWAIEKIPVLLSNKKNLIRLPIFEVKAVSDDILTTTEWYLKCSPAGNGSNKWNTYTFTIPWAEELREASV
jgi:hypothetical protein